MADLSIANDLLENLGGVDTNDLNSVLKNDNESDDFVDSYERSNYYDIASLQ